MGLVFCNHFYQRFAQDFQLFTKCICIEKQKEIGLRNHTQSWKLLSPRLHYTEGRKETKEKVIKDN